MLVAAATAGLALLWLVADVQLADEGHLNGLFYTGANAPLPSGAFSDHTYRVRDKLGYDGQFYHLIAHDPLNRHGYLAFTDGPRYRWRRIGLPGLAYLFAFGNASWIDGLYVAWELVFVFLGAYWLAAYAQRNHRSTLWGAAFLLIPAVAISLDRMMVDLPLAAMCVAVLLYGSSGRPHWIAYAALAAAPLFRETGILLILAWCVFWTVKGLRGFALREDAVAGDSRTDFRYACLGGLSALPVLGWWWYVAEHTAPDPMSFLASFPFHGLIEWTLHALAAPVAAYGPRANAALELVALAGIWLAFALAVRIAVKRRFHATNWDLPELTVLAFAAFASLIGYQDIWASAYGIGRTLSPLLIALGAIALRDRRLLFAMPTLLTVPRIALQFAAEIKVALSAHS